MILRLVICLCGLLLTAVIAGAQARELPPLPAGVKNVGDPAKIKAVLAREDDFLNAYKTLDAKVAADLYSEDYLQLTMDKWCCVATKELQVGALIQRRDGEPTNPISSIKNEQVVVRVHGNIAIVTGVQTIRGSEMPVVPIRFLFMNVWELTNGKWTIIGGSKKVI
jgi:ketosteroid isomerase-like protein